MSDLPPRSSRRSSSALPCGFEATQQAGRRRPPDPLHRLSAMPKAEQQCSFHGRGALWPCRFGAARRVLRIAQSDSLTQ